MVAVWLVEVAWWALAVLWRPISWLIGSAVLVQLVLAFVDGSGEAWFGPVRTLGMWAALAIFLAHARHPWECLSPEARLKRAKGPFARRSLLGPGNPRELSFVALIRRGRRPPSS